MGERNCETCEFSGRPSYKSPCANCRQTFMGRSNWTERQKKQTNADKIRAMTDQQLAAYLTKVQINVLNAVSDKLGVERHYFDGYEIALAETLWTVKLKQEVSDNG